MMRNNIIIYFIITILTFSAFEASSQFRKKNPYSKRYGKSNSKKYSNYKGGRVGYSTVGNPKYMTVGVSVNGNNYFGDITQTSRRLSSDYTFVPSGFGITASKVISPGIFARAGFNYGVISASDFETGTEPERENGALAPGNDPSATGRWARNYHFRNAIKELSVGLEVDMLPTQGGARRRFPINPYGFLGVAVFHHKPEAKAPDEDQADNPTFKGGEWIDLQSIGTEGQYIDSLGLKPYSKWQFSIPLGVGVKVKLSKSFDLNVEIGFRYLFTDYLDDIGGDYVDLDAFGDNYLARSLSERGAEESGPDGESRNIDGITGNVDVGLETGLFEDWDNSNTTYTHGNNYVPGNPRGGSAKRDWLVTTQIRLVYIINKTAASRGKFR